MTMDLYALPLAARLRPTSIHEVIGQKHLLAEGKPLHAMARNKRLFSCILWGPPGCGKTTLASLLAEAVGANVIHLSAVGAGVKDIRDAVARAREAQQQGKATVVFLDEIHRFSSAQQDALLPHVEQGTIVLIGATTENPSFAINHALLSRMRIYALQALNEDDLKVALNRALSCYAPRPIVLDATARKMLINLSHGDVRRLLTVLEIAIDVADNDVVSLEHIRSAAGEQSVAMDKLGDEWYFLLSAFHKSVRGSDVDAALFWYARWVLATQDPVPIARRLLAIASEDIGNADPRALGLCLDAWDCFHRVGPAEGERAIAQAVVYCALAPKSNAVYRAWNAAKQYAQEHSHTAVPMHLRNAVTAYNKTQGYGRGYRYAHNEPYAIAAGQHYFPDDVVRQRFYHPTERGFEKQLNERLLFVDAINTQAKEN